MVGETVAANAMTEVPLRMLDNSHVLGSYGEIVAGLQEQLRILLRNNKRSSVSDPLQLLVVGHGGRDSCCSLAVIEAVASDESLSGQLQVHICTCSWPDDTWEEVFVQYLAHIEQKGMIAKGAVQVHSMKFHREHDQISDNLRMHLQNKAAVVQCEQGVDLFVGPLSSQWLQDNYEDHVVHHICMDSTQRARVPVFLVQTNSGLDLCRGIVSSDIQNNIFHGRLQGEAFVQNISFRESVPEECPASLMDLAKLLGSHGDKCWAFKTYLGVDPAGNFALGQVSNFYAGFIVFGAASNVQLPVAGVLEVITSLQLQGHTMPWHFQQEGQPPAPPQWLLGRLLQPVEAPNGQLRVLTEFREANLHSAKSVAQYLSCWMHGRKGRREHGTGKDTQGRFARNFRAQLLLAKHVAKGVKVSCPDFDLWLEGPKLLQEALVCFNRTAAASKALAKKMTARNKVAKAREPDFEYVPAAFFCAAANIMVLDFTCRLLESTQGVDAEFEDIWKFLPTRPSDMDDASDMKSTGAETQALVEVFKQGLINAWRDVCKSSSNHLAVSHIYAGSSYPCLLGDFCHAVGHYLSCGARKLEEDARCASN
eukprot:TRINITY_DN27869_c0_g1_i1.p1 TRINITY_DN27869_c0_g1~~TRINITY_DN27869_c0_g1_i1.p1  ORF type:complete len:607 (-),score=118.58 TRINITY_DN27869_c0_g1_i1:133-1911(-)